MLNQTIEEKPYNIALYVHYDELINTNLKYNI